MLCAFFSQNLFIFLTNNAFFHSFNYSFNNAVKIFIQRIYSFKKNAKYSFKEFIHSNKTQIIHSKNLFIKKKWKLFIQRKYSFKWKMEYRPGLSRHASFQDIWFEATDIASISYPLHSGMIHTLTLIGSLLWWIKVLFCLS